MSGSTKRRESNRLLLVKLREEINVSESDDSSGLCISNCDSDICDYSSTGGFIDLSNEYYNVHENIEKNQSELASDLKNWVS